jgi:hypothetical protein
MIWTGYREESWTYRRVTWPGFEEREDYTVFTGGEIDLSALSTLRASGTLDFTGGSLPSEHDLVRVYYRITDETGETYETPLGTFFMAVGSPDYEGSMVSGTVDLESTLMVPSNGSYGRHYTVKAGTNAVSKAKEIMDGLGLRTNATASSYTLAKDVIYDPDDSWLTICNDLLSMAGYGSCSPDPYGTIRMAPYVEPQDRQASWTFSDGTDSIMLPKVSVSDNSEDIPNVVRLVHESEDESLWAASVNEDPLSPASTVSRGYECCLNDTISELSGDTKDARLENLKTMARKKLVDNSSSIEYVEWGFPWVPLWPNDAISISYLTARLDWHGAVTEMKVEVGGHCSVTGKARRFVRKGFVTREDGGSW